MSNMRSQKGVLMYTILSLWTTTTLVCPVMSLLILPPSLVKQNTIQRRNIFLQRTKIQNPANIQRRSSLLSEQADDEMVMLRLTSDLLNNRTSSSYIRPDDIDLDNLQPPAFNLRKESLLFGEESASKKNNNMLMAWKFCKENFPRIITGARQETTGDDNPVGALYNIVFVRVPAILAGVVYIINLTNDHPLIVNFGAGPLEMNPIAVFAILYFLLR